MPRSAKKNVVWKSRLNARPAEAEAIRAEAASGVLSSQAPVEVPCQAPAASPVRATPTEPFDPVVLEGEAAIGASVSADCCGGTGHPPGPAATPLALAVQDLTTIHLGDDPGDLTTKQRHSLRADHPEPTGSVQPVETHSSKRNCFCSS